MNERRLLESLRYWWSVRRAEQAFGDGHDKFYANRIRWIVAAIRCVRFAYAPEGFAAGKRIFPQIWARGYSM